MQLKFLTLAAALVFASCAAYRAEPLDPIQSQAAFQSRTLSNPSLLKSLGLTQPPQYWTLDELTKVAIYYHPDVAVARADLRAVAAAEITAGESPNPTMAISPEYSFNPADASPWVLGWTFDIPIETAGKRKLRIKQAKALTNAADIELANTLWQIRSHLRDALAEFLLDQREVQLLSGEVETRTKFVSLWTARISAGEASRPDATTAQTDLLTARQAYFAAQGQLADARTKLAAALGVPTGALTDQDFADPTLDKFSPVSPDVLQRNTLANRLDLRQALAEYTAAQDALRLEVAKQYPDLHIGPGYTFDQGQNKFQLGLSMELPIFNQNAGGVAEAQTHRRELAAKFLSVQAAALADTDSASARYQFALQELDQASQQMSTLTTQVNSTQKLFDAGEEDRLTLTSTQVQQQVTRLLYLDALRKAQSARAALEDALQIPLDVQEVRP